MSLPFAQGNDQASNAASRSTSPSITLTRLRVTSTTPSAIPEERRSIVSPTLVPENTFELPTTTEVEIWAWYVYHVGANGIGHLNLAPTVLQDLLLRASVHLKLYFAGQERDIDSIVSLCNGIVLAIQAVLLLVMGAFADYGSCRRWVLLVWSILSYSVGFCWLAAQIVETWRIAAISYIIGLVSYHLTTTYWIAAFPSLARNTQHLKACRALHENGEMTTQELLRADELERSRLSNTTLLVQRVVETTILSLMTGILMSVGHDDDKRDQTAADDGFGIGGGGTTDIQVKNRPILVLITLATGFRLIFYIPWCVLEKNRPGLRLPRRAKKRFTAGFSRLFITATQIWTLKQSLVFLLGYFFLAYSLDTTVRAITRLYNQIMEYDGLMLTRILLTNMAVQSAGIHLYWRVQQTFRIRVKTMFNAIMVFILLLSAWGMVGNWTNRLGFRTRTEFWAFQLFYGICISPFYSYAQIVISSVTPAGHESLFFSVFQIAGTTSSLIGPSISSTLVEAMPRGSNESTLFYFLFALNLVSVAGIWKFLDLEESAREQQGFLARESVRVDGDVQRGSLTMRGCDDAMTRGCEDVM
ncbi:hypothetical protein E4U21_000941 [Claviceps maximensis]|nr:hypothetical protein E4U21_000941 [Claviceps maximensis]